MPQLPILRAPGDEGPASSTALKYSGTRLYLLLLVLITSAYCLWVLSLPLFPTQDGPMHLYYTHVLHALLFGSPGIYSRFYAIRHILPPYALYYYTLMLLSHFVPLILADKLVVCIYLLCFAFGFRFLATSVGPRGNLMALLATPLLLNWSLGMGFLNFCLSSAIVLWALGLWCRASGTLSSPASSARRLGFVLLAYIAMFTHPIPILMLVTFCLIDIGIRVLLHRRRRSLTPLRLTSDLFALAAAMGTLLYVKLFTVKVAVPQASTLKHAGFLHESFANARFYALQRSLSYFGGHAPIDFASRILLASLLLLPLALALHQRLRNHRLGLWTLGDTWLVVSLTLSLSLPFIPNEVNNAHYFGARLVPFALLAALAAASASTWSPQASSTQTKRSTRSAGLAFALTVTILSVNLVFLVTAESRIRPVARNLVTLANTPPPFTQQVGLLLASPTYLRPGNLSFDPYYWSGATFFRQTESVLYNSPWLIFSVMPLQATDLMPTNRISPIAMEQPEIFTTLLESRPAIRRQTLPQASFAINNSGANPASDMINPALVSATPGPAAWICTPATFYALCTQP